WLEPLTPMVEPSTLTARVKLPLAPPSVPLKAAPAASSRSALRLPSSERTRYWASEGAAPPAPIQLPLSKQTVPDALGKVMVLSWVGSVTARVVSKPLAVAPSNTSGEPPRISAALKLTAPVAVRPPLAVTNPEKVGLFTTLTVMLPLAPPSTMEMLVPAVRTRSLDKLPLSARVTNWASAGAALPPPIQLPAVVQMSYVPPAASARR